MKRKKRKVEDGRESRLKRKRREKDSKEDEKEKMKEKAKRKKCSFRCLATNRDEDWTIMKDSSRYGDNVEEMDAGVGEILAALHEHGLEENTIVYFVSDNGGYLEAVDEDNQRTGGYNGLFKGLIMMLLVF